MSTCWIGAKSVGSDFENNIEENNEFKEQPN